MFDRLAAMILALRRPSQYVAVARMDIINFPLVCDQQQEDEGTIDALPHTGDALSGARMDAHIHEDSFSACQVLYGLWWAAVMKKLLEVPPTAEEAPLMIIRWCLTAFCSCSGQSSITSLEAIGPRWNNEPREREIRQAKLSCVFLSICTGGRPSYRSNVFHERWLVFKQPREKVSPLRLIRK